MLALLSCEDVDCLLVVNTHLSAFQHPLQSKFVLCCSLQVLLQNSVTHVNLFQFFCIGVF